MVSPAVQKRRAPGRPSVKEAENIQKQILRAATKEFIASGYVKCNMDEVARIARSTKPTIYRIFSSKEMLFKAVISSELRASIGDFGDMFANVASPREVLTETARIISRSYSCGTLTGLWRAVVSVKSQFPDLAHQAMEVISQESIVSRLQAYFEELDRLKILKVPTPNLAAQHFMLLIGPASELLSLSQHQYSDEERIEEVVNLFMKGFAPDLPEQRVAA